MGFEVALGPAGGTLSTAPGELSTHWYQTRFLLRNPLSVLPGAQLNGRLEFIAHARRSYFMQVEITDKNTGLSSSENLIDLHNAWYRMHSSIFAYRPPDLLLRAAFRQNEEACTILLGFILRFALAACLVNLQGTKDDQQTGCMHAHIVLCVTKIQRFT